MILKDDGIHSLFRDDPLTTDGILSILEISYSKDQQAALLEESTFHHFKKILKNVAKGKITYKKDHKGTVMTNKLDLDQILFWLTGSRRMSATQWKIKVAFELDFPPTKRRPKIKTCPGCAELTLPIVAHYSSLEEVFVEAMAEGTLGYSNI